MRIRWNLASGGGLICCQSM